MKTITICLLALFTSAIYAQKGTPVPTYFWGNTNVPTWTKNQAAIGTTQISTSTQLYVQATKPSGIYVIQNATSGTVYGMNSVVNSSTSSTQYGMKTHVGSGGTGTKYGMKTSVVGHGSNNRYGTYTEIIGGNTMNRYALYAKVSGSYGYAGYFEGNTYFSDFVGIGLSKEQNVNNYTLAVNGSIGAKEIKIEISETPWPDYVFADEYALKSIEEVEAFIDENHHLPNIPSAGSIEEEGSYSVKDMQIKMLEKMEEMMLYIIELKNENKALKAQIEQK